MQFGWWQTLLTIVVCVNAAVFDSTTSYCHDASIQIKTRTGCVQVFLGEKYVFLYPSFDDDAFVLWKQTPSRTFNARLGTDDVTIDNHLLRVPVHIDHVNTTAVCDGVFPLGKLSPIWQCWNVAVMEPGRMRLLTNTHSQYFVPTTNTWQINDVVFTLVPDMSSANVFSSGTPVMLTLPPHPALKRHLLQFSLPWLTRALAQDASFPTLQYLSKHRVHTRDVYYFTVDTLSDDTIAYWPPAIHLSNETQITFHRSASAAFGIMLHGATQQIRLFPLPSAGNWVINVWYNGIAWQLLLFLLALCILVRAGAGLPVDSWTVAPLSSELNDKNNGLVLNVTYLRHAIFVVLFTMFCITDSVALHWEEQTCMYAGVCLSGHTLLITGVVVGVGGWLLLFLLPHPCPWPHADVEIMAQWLHTYCMLLLSLVVASVPFQAENKFAPLHAFVMGIGLVLINFETLSAVQWIYVRLNFFGQCLLMWILALVVLTNLAVMFIQVHPLFVRHMDQYGLPVLWSVVFWLVTGFLLPFIFVVQNTSQLNSAKKTK